MYGLFFSYGLIMIFDIGSDFDSNSRGIQVANTLKGNSVLLLFYFSIASSVLSVFYFIK